MVSFDWTVDCRMEHCWETKNHLCPQEDMQQENFDDHNYFGVHRVDGGWVYREWAPHAHQVFLTGEFNEWHGTSHPMMPLGNGAWVLFLAGEDALWEGCKVKTIVETASLCVREER